MCLGCVYILLIIIIIYIYHVLINALSPHIEHINLNMIFYTHVEHSPIKNNLHILRKHAHTHTQTHTSALLLTFFFLHCLPKGKRLPKTFFRLHYVLSLHSPFCLRCSRAHVRPESSTTLLIPGMFQNFELHKSNVDDYDTGERQASWLPAC